MMRDVISYNNKADKIDSILLNYNPTEILDKWNEESLFQKFKESFKINNSESKGNSWRQWSNGIISGCKYISKFKSVDDLVDYFDSSQKNENDQLELAEILAKNIRGMGFALACDFLKEIGYDYPKPDVHIIEVFSSLGYCSKDEPKDAFKAVIKFARDNNISAYKSDKMIWLICSGRFYRHNIQVVGKRTELINELLVLNKVNKSLTNFKIKDEIEVIVDKDYNNLTTNINSNYKIDIIDVTAKNLGVTIKNVKIILENESKYPSCSGELHQRDDERITIGPIFVNVAVHNKDDKKLEYLIQRFWVQSKNF